MSDVWLTDISIQTKASILVFPEWIAYFLLKKKKTKPNPENRKTFCYMRILAGSYLSSMPLIFTTFRQLQAKLTSKFNSRRAQQPQQTNIGHGTAKGPPRTASTLPSTSLTSPQNQNESCHWQAYLILRTAHTGESEHGQPLS